MTEPADAIAEALATSGVDTAFGLPGGGANLDLIGAMHTRRIRFVLGHTETAATIMAAAWGYIRDRTTVALVTRGPGAASAVNGAAQATLDRHPVLLVADTVGVSTRERVAHQRLDQIAMLEPVTKANGVLGSDAGVEQVRDLLDHAAAWPAGAIHVDYDAAASSTVEPSPPFTPPDLDLTALKTNVDQANRPLVIVGAAALAEADLVRQVIEAFGAPVLTTYQATGIISTEGPLNAGHFTNGETERPILEASDLVILVGVDLVEPRSAPWSYDTPVISVSPRPTLDPYLPILTEAVTESLGQTLDELFAGAAHTWGANAGATHRQDVRSALGDGRVADFGPLALVETLAAAAPATATTTVDAGAHFLAIMPFWPVAEPRHLLISNGLATMGYAVPAAIGAALARPEQPVVALTGDGGLGMTLNELETIVRHQLAITVVVFNDSTLSLIEIKQQAGHGDETAVRYGPTDFAAVAEAQGMDSHVVTTALELEELLAATTWDRPRLIDARINPGSYPHLIKVTRG